MSQCCGRCGNALQPHHRFCISCGAPVAQSAVPPPPVAQSAVPPPPIAQSAAPPPPPPVPFSPPAPVEASMPEQGLLTDTLSRKRWLLAGTCALLMVLVLGGLSFLAWSVLGRAKEKKDAAVQPTTATPATDPAPAPAPALAPVDASIPEPDVQPDPQKARREQALSLRNQAVDLEQKGDWAGAIAKWRESQTFAPDPRLDERIAQLQTRVEQAGATSREKALALRNQALELEQKADWPGAIQKWRESQTFVPDPRLDERIAQLQTRAQQAGATPREKALALRNQALELEQKGNWSGAIQKWRESQTFVPDPRLDERIRQLQARVDSTR